MLPYAALAALALLASARAEDPAPVPVPEEPPIAAPAREKLKWLILPNLSYDSDDKLGFGARAEVIQPRAGLDPYRSSFVLHGFATTNGYHHHRFRFDLVGLGPKERMRVTGHFAFRAWLNDGYWGIGNGTEREVSYEDAAADDPDRKRYRYSLIQPFGQVALRHAVSSGDVASPLSLYGSVNVRYTVVDASAGSLLLEQQPLGMDGGLGVQLIAGALWDTREPEVTPDEGWLLEVAGRGVTGMYTFGGPFVSARAWGRIAPGVVVAQRVMGEWLFGEVPFYEMVFWGGVVPIPGMGGSDTIRGVAFGRWRGPGKAVSNTELRLDVLRHRALKQELRWQLVPFVDLGTVWGSGDTATAPDPALPVHPAVGGGIRAIWGESIVGRVDAGVSPDLTDEGPALQWGLYLMFDHMF
ncbi:MAG: BamA/TamA family outer membrane protein [Pseudomonadota bacterium]|nr:BamA/TamA family outer membrane protein [Pseudomonadota bacterium]